MITTIAKVALPVDEVLEIKKNRILPAGAVDVPAKGRWEAVEAEAPAGPVAADGTALRRISVVTGIHGDELEGQYVAYELQRRMAQHPEYLTGVVDIYPAMNPLGIDSITRGIPAFDLDMNRLFPGNREGNMTEYLAAKIIEDLKGSDVVVDIHASNIFLTEIPQIRINELHQETLVPLAKQCNMDFIWVHGAATVLEATLAYSLNSVGTPTLVVEMGVGMRISREYGDQMVDGLFSLMAHLGIWAGPVVEPRKPIVSEDWQDVSYLNASTGGLFVPEVQHWTHLEEGQVIGHIVDPLRGEVLDTVTAPVEGVLFTLRDYPVVDEGSLLGRMLKKEVCDR